MGGVYWGWRLWRGGGAALNLDEDNQSPHSAAASTLLILSVRQFKGTLNGIKDLFKALILIGRGFVLSHQKKKSERERYRGEECITAELAEILMGKIGRGFVAQGALKSEISAMESLL